VSNVLFLIRIYSMKLPFAMMAGLYGAVGVALGAFGAHALRERLSPADLAIFETAVRYQFYHVFALLAAQALIVLAGPNDVGAMQTARQAAWAFVVGMTIFSGSLYLLVATGVRKLGMVTPLGGVLLILGWLLLALAAKKVTRGPWFNL